MFKQILDSNLVGKDWNRKALRLRFLALAGGIGSSGIWTVIVIFKSIVCILSLKNL